MERMTLQGFTARIQRTQRWIANQRIEWHAEKQRATWASDAFTTWAHTRPSIAYPVRGAQHTAELSPARPGNRFPVREPYEASAVHIRQLGWALEPRIGAFTQYPDMIADLRVANETFVLSTSLAIAGRSTLCLFSPNGIRLAAALLIQRGDDSHACSSIATADSTRGKGYATLLTRCLMPLTDYPHHFDVMHMVSSNPLFSAALDSLSTRDADNHIHNPSLITPASTLLGRTPTHIELLNSTHTNQQLAAGKVTDISLRLHFDRKVPVNKR